MQIPGRKKFLGNGNVLKKEKQRPKNFLTNPVSARYSGWPADCRNLTWNIYIFLPIVSKWMCRLIQFDISKQIRCYILTPMQIDKQDDVNTNSNKKSIGVYCGTKYHTLIYTDVMSVYLNAFSSLSVKNIVKFKMMFNKLWWLLQWSADEKRGIMCILSGWTLSVLNIYLHRNQLLFG